MAEIADYFRPISDEALESGLLNPKNLGVNIKTSVSGTGWNAFQPDIQLKEQGAEDKFYEVLEEVPRVRKDLGEAAACYTVFSDRWYSGSIQRADGRTLQMATKETKDVLTGKYGATAKPFNQKYRKKVIGEDAEVITCRPSRSDSNETGYTRKRVCTCTASRMRMC